MIVYLKVNQMPMIIATLMILMLQYSSTVLWTIIPKIFITSMQWCYGFKPWFPKHEWYYFYYYFLYMTNIFWLRCILLVDSTNFFPNFSYCSWYYYSTCWIIFYSCLLGVYSFIVSLAPSISSAIAPGWLPQGRKHRCEFKYIGRQDCVSLFQCTLVSSLQGGWSFVVNYQLIIINKWL